MPPALDRALLLAIFALRRNLISRDDLVGVLSHWTGGPDSSLGRLLLGQGRLTSQDLQLLGALVEEHLRIPPPELTGPYAPAPSADFGAGPGPGIAQAGQRYRVLRPHARGGLGEVFLAEDTELHRPVALKEIQERYADDPASRHRFVREAEVTGRLEHPGIVPVYGLGHYADGRPFYAMRFVEGESLQEAVRRFHTAETPGRDPGERRLAFRELLGRFVAVCNAVAYAHSREVLHRDLKPANAMLGKYGETLLVDWGLAKVLGRPDGQTDGGGAPEPMPAGELPQTQVGTILGTPAYMSPEQAQGRGEEVGPASDIYSLGATLYTLLTGRAPLQGRDKGELLRQAVRGEWRPPARVKKDVPRALDAVCRKAMAKRPEDRYPTALALAADVEHWLADEPVSAYSEPLRVRLGRWARRHKPAVAAAAAAVLVGVLLGGAGLVWAQRRAEKRERAVVAALAKAAAMQRQARWAEARAVLEQAENQLGEGGPEELRRKVERARGDLDLVARLDGIRLKRSSLVEGRIDYAAADRGYAAAFREAGLGTVGEDTERVAARLRASAVREKLLAALDDWAAFLGRGESLNWVLAVAWRVDPSPWRARSPKVWSNLKDLAQLAREARAEGPSPRFLAALGARVLWLGGDGEPLLRAAQGRLPGDFWVNFELGIALFVKKPREAVTFFRVALALRPDSPFVQTNLGTALNAQGRSAAAIRAFRRAIVMNPKFALAYNNLGLALKAQGKLAGAVRAYRRAIALDPKFAPAHSNLGNALYARGKRAAGVRAYRRAIALDPGLAPAHYNLGLALQNQGRRAEAIQEFRRAIVLDPKDVQAHNHLGASLHDLGKVGAAVRAYRKAIALDPKYAPSYYNLGNALYARGERTEAVRAYRRALALDPKYAPAHHNFGAALHDQGKLTLAIREYRKAITLDPHYSEPHNNLGNALKAQGKLAEAVKEYRRAIALDPKRAAFHTNLGNALMDQGQLAEAGKEYRRAIALDPNYAKAHKYLGISLYAQGKRTEAVRAYRRALALDPKDAQAHNNLGSVLQDQGKFRAAVREYRRAIVFDPKLAPAHYNLGNALYAQGQRAGAVRAYRRAVALDPKFSRAHYNLGNALYAQGKLAAAVRAYRRAIASDPKNAQAQGALGHALLSQGRFTEARQATRRCLGLLPSGHFLRQAVAQQLRRCEQMVVLDRKLASTLQGEAKPGSPAEQLNLAYLCLRYKKRYALATGFFTGAFAAQVKFAEDLRAGHRYNASCAAALAAACKGADAAKLDAQEKARLRGQARAWLRADLALRNKQINSGQPPERQAAQQALRHWQQDPDLAGVRDKVALAKLPEAERKDWAKLWAEVDALLKKAGPKQ
jgi:tetratricopeptide (TPR) repeat protein/tRNA A-37 threonylcarbamoyl transferase component Bud32